MRSLFLVVLALSPILGLAQGFVLQRLPLSAEAQIVSEAGSFGAAEDPSQFFRNPALLADLGDGARLSSGLTSPWLGVDDLQISALAASMGIRTSLLGRPASLGLGLGYGVFDQGRILLVGGDGNETATDEPSDQTLAFGIGLGVDGPVRIRGGVTGQWHERTTFVGFRELSPSTASALTADVGLDATVPLGEWLQPRTTASGSWLALDLSLGYSLRGVEVLTSAPEADVVVRPTRTPTAGAGLLVGLDLERSSTSLRALSVEFLAEAEQEDATFWGDIGPGSVLLGRGTDTVTGRRGLRLTLAETVTLGGGQLGGRNFVDRITLGSTVSWGGALRALGYATGDPQLSALGERFDLRLSYALMVLDPDAPFDTTPTYGLVGRYRP